MANRTPRKPAPRRKTAAHDVDTLTGELFTDETSAASRAPARGAACAGADAGGSDAAGFSGSTATAGGICAAPDILQSQPLRSAVGTQLYFFPGWNVSTLP